MVWPGWVRLPAGCWRLIGSAGPVPAAGSTITSAPRVHHTRPPTPGPHDGPHNRRLAWVATDGAGGRAWLTWVQVLPALCQVVARRDEDWGVPGHDRAACAGVRRP